MKIISVHYNKPQYISHQYNSLLKFFDGNFEYYVINNSPDDDISKRIQEECRKIKCFCIDIQNNFNFCPSSSSHAYSLNFSLNYVKENEDVLFLDHDVFLVKKFKIDKNYDILSIKQQRGHVEYPWPGVLLFNNIKNIKDIDFFPQYVEGVQCDTGGKLFHYIKNNNCKVKYFTQYFVFENIDNIDTDIIDDCFLHICKGSNWNNSDILDKKYKLIKDQYGINLADL